MENSTELPQKIKNRTTMWPRNPILWIYPKELKAGSQRDICIHIYISNISNSQLRCSLTDESKSKMWYIPTVEYYSALKKKFWHILILNLEDIMLSEISQSPKGKNTVWFHLYETSSSQIHRNRKKNGGYRGLWGGGQGQLLFHGYRIKIKNIFIWKDKKCSGDLFHNNMNLFNTAELYS